MVPEMNIMGITVNPEIRVQKRVQNGTSPDHRMHGMHHGGPIYGDPLRDDMHHLGSKWGPRNDLI